MQEILTYLIVGYAAWRVAQTPLRAAADVAAHLLLRKGKVKYAMRLRAFAQRKQGCHR